MENRRGREGQGLPSLSLALRHHWLIVVVVTLLFSAAGATYAMSITRTFTSTAVILISPAPGNPLSVDAASGSAAQLSVAMQTEANVARSPGVAELVAGELGRAVPGEGESLRTDIPTGTQMMSVSFTSTDAARAQDSAQAFAENYLSFRQGRAQQNVEARLGALEEQEEAADQNLQRASREAAGTEGGAYASQEVQLYVDRLASVRDQISNTQFTTTDPGRIINPAEAPSAPNEPATSMVIGAALLVGLALGGLGALVLEWRRDLVREHDDLEVDGVPVLAHIDHAFIGEGPDEAGEEVQEAFRRLRAGIVANASRPHVIAVASVGRKGASSHVSSNLAVALARAKFSVALVAADPLSDEIARVFSIAPEPGLADVLAGRVKATDAIVGANGVSVLPGGRDASGTRELFAGLEFRSLVAELKAEHDFVVVDAAPAATADGDAVIISADSVLLVLTTGKTTHSEIQATIDRFDRLHVSPIGAVRSPLTHTPVRHDRESDAGKRERGKTTQEVDVRAFA